MMRRTFVCMAVGLAALVVAVPQAAAQAPVGDSVTGNLFDQIETGIQVFSLDARSGPAGENPTGTAELHIGGGLGPTWNVAVTCLAVDGNRAVIGFSGTHYFLGMLQPVAGLARAIDGGAPASGQDSFEWVQVIGPEGGTPIPGPTDCSSYPASFTPGGGPGFNRTGGDIVVTDAQPLPTTKDQCKNGGWRTYGVFKNQGECIRFVRRQARKACIAERTAIGRPAFRAKYGTGKQHRHALRNCVRQKINI